MREALQKLFWLHIWRKISCFLSVYQLNKGKVVDLLSCYDGSHEMTFKTCQGLINRSPHHNAIFGPYSDPHYVHRHAHKRLPRPWHSSQSEKPAFSQALKLSEMSACWCCVNVCKLTCFPFLCLFVFVAWLMEMENFPLTS